MSVSSTIKKTTLFVVDVPFFLLYALVFVLTYVGVFDFLYSWPLILSYLFFLLLTVLIFVPSKILRALIIYLIIKERHCTRLVCSSETPKAGLEGLGKMRHVKDRVADALLSSVGAAVAPLAVLVLKGMKDGVYPSDASPLFIALFPWSVLWMDLVWRILEFRTSRYADGLSFRETLQEMMLYTGEKKFGSMAFLIAVATLAMYWGLNVVVNASLNNLPASFYHFIVVLVVSVTSLVVFAVVLGWALDVFTRRLFGEALGKFLFATFVLGAVFHPFLGLLSTFFFSWALFGKARDAAVAAAIAALSLFVVMLPGLVWTSVLLL
jgi:hypothetical protein